VIRKKAINYNTKYASLFKLGALNWNKLQQAFKTLKISPNIQGTLATIIDRTPKLTALHHDNPISAVELAKNMLQSNKKYVPMKAK